MSLNPTLGVSQVELAAVVRQTGRSDLVLRDVPEHLEEDSCVGTPGLDGLLAHRVELPGVGVVQGVSDTTCVRNALSSPLVHVVVQNNPISASSDPVVRRHDTEGVQVVHLGLVATKGLHTPKGAHVPQMEGSCNVCGQNLGRVWHDAHTAERVRVTFQPKDGHTLYVGVPHQSLLVQSSREQAVIIHRVRQGERPLLVSLEGLLGFHGGSVPHEDASIGGR
mmetsp:Transcript_4407/g.8403  ORF Transcript_4407/g.8403 Transcript_4407/m.8403 type:complete len:222 (-) Transcript_4407:53-718(-)